MGSGAGEARITARGADRLDSPSASVGRARSLRMDEWPRVARCGHSHWHTGATATMSSGVGVDRAGGSMGGGMRRYSFSRIAQAASWSSRSSTEESRAYARPATTSGAELVNLVGDDRPGAVRTRPQPRRKRKCSHRRKEPHRARRWHRPDRPAPGARKIARGWPLVATASLAAGRPDTGDSRARSRSTASCRSFR
jgi:hypothetical protein